MSGSKSSLGRPIVEWLSVTAAIATGPVFMLMVDLLSLDDLLTLCSGLFVWAVVVSLIIRISGRFRYVVWQLAAVSLTISSLAHHLPFEDFPMAHLRELAVLDIVVWLISSVISAPLPITLLVESVRDRKKGLRVKINSSIVPPGL